MKKLLILILLVGLVGSASAITTTWKIVGGGGVDQDWNNALNWSAGVPVSHAPAGPYDSVTLYASTSQANGPVVTGTSVGDQIRCGGAGGPGGTTAHLTIQSGSLTVSDFLLVAPDSTTGGGRNGTLHMDGGTLNMLLGQGALGIGHGSDGNPVGSQNIIGTLDMTGGDIFAKWMEIGANLTKGIVYLSGGTIDLIDWVMRPNAANPNAPELHISGTGKMIINGDRSAQVQGYIDNGWINDDVVIDLTMNPGRTTLYVPEPATICILGIGLLGLIRRK